MKKVEITDETFKKNLKKFREYLMDKFIEMKNE